MNLEANNKVTSGGNKKLYESFLADINPNASQRYAGRDSMNSSHMMIEISDLDVKDPLVRANTITEKLGPGADYATHMRAIPVQKFGNKSGIRYGNTSNSIVASARNELEQNF